MPTLRRVLYETVGHVFLRRLIPAFTSVLLFALLAEAVVDWDALRREIAGTSPGARTAIFTAAFVAWSIAAGRALRPAWQLPAIAFLIRQPLSHWQWLGGLAPSLLIALLPVSAIWLLAPDHGNPLIHQIGFVGLAWPLMIGAAFRPRHALMVFATGLTVLVALLALYWRWPWVAWVGAAATVLQAGWSVSLVRRQPGQSARRSTARLTAPGPVRAIIRRDLHCLLRTERSALLQLAVISAAACAVMLALRVNGEVSGQSSAILHCRYNAL